MANVAENTQWEMLDDNETEDRVIPSSTTLYEGGYAAIETGRGTNPGKAAKYNDASNLMPSGGCFTLQGNVTPSNPYEDTDGITGNAAGDVEIGLYKDGFWLITDISGVADTDLFSTVFLLDDNLSNLVLEAPFDVEEATKPAMGDPIGVLEARLDTSTKVRIRGFSRDLLYVLTVAGSLEVKEIGPFPLATISASDANFFTLPLYDHLKLLTIKALVSVAASTASKATDIIAKKSTAVISTEGVELTTANCTQGAVVEATDLTPVGPATVADKIFHPGESIILATQGSTAFVEGEVIVQLVFQKLPGN